MNDDRIVILEQRFEGFTVNVDKKLDNITEALRSLVRIEERQLATGDRLAQGSQTFQDHETRLRKIEIAVPENLDKRLSSIEVSMPGLKESRGWVIAGVLGGLAMMGGAIVHTVLK